MKSIQKFIAIFALKLKYILNALIIKINLNNNLYYYKLFVIY